MDRGGKPGRASEWVVALFTAAVLGAVALWADGKVLYALGAVVLVVVALRVLSGIIAALLVLIVGRP